MTLFLLFIKIFEFFDFEFDLVTQKFTQMQQSQQN
jgi:hypothetical protein